LKSSEKERSPLPKNKKINEGGKKKQRQQQQRQQQQQQQYGLIKPLLLLSHKYQNTNTKNAFKPNPKNQTKPKQNKK